MTPLYGHLSFESGYEVGSYPFGFKLRCKIRYWIESDPKKGYRFCSQTTNPKKSYESWNAPKKSTYSKLAGCMFLNEEGHCKWDGLTEYSKAEEVSEFLTTFRGVRVAREGAEMIAQLRVWCALKVKYLQGRLEGKSKWVINGVVTPDSDYEKLEMQNELKVWEECITKLNTPLDTLEQDHD